MIILEDVAHAIESGKIPLPMVVELGQNGLSDLWAHEPDPSWLANILFRTAILPIEVVVRSVEIVAQEELKVKEKLIDSYQSKKYKELNELLSSAIKFAKTKTIRIESSDGQWVYVFSDLIEIAQRRWNSKSGRDGENAWGVLANAIVAIREATIFGVSHRDTQIFINDTILTATYSGNPAIDKKLANMLRPYGPPTLQQIVAAAKARAK